MLTQYHRHSIYIGIGLSTLLWSIIHSRPTITALACVFLCILGLEIGHIYIQNIKIDQLKAKVASYIYTPSIIVSIIGLGTALLISRSWIWMIALIVAVYIYSYDHHAHLGYIGTYRLTRSDIAIIGGLTLTYMTLHFFRNQDATVTYTLGVVSMWLGYSIIYSIITKAQKRSPREICTDIVRLILTIASVCMMVYTYIYTYTQGPSASALPVCETSISVSDAFWSTPMIPLDLCQ